MAPDPCSYAILLTSPHPAAIAVIRLAGPSTARFRADHLDKPVKSGRCIHCNVIDNHETLDDVVAVEVNESTIDLNVHGGVWVVQSILDLAARCGFTRSDGQSAPPDRIVEADDPIEQQVLLDLPRAHTRQAIEILLGQPEAWRVMRADNDTAAMRQAAGDRSLGNLLNPPTVAIIGAPNVGKSTLANQLFARDHSITADLPGTTRDWVGERANLDGLIVTLVDTPGQRVTDDPIESAAIDRAKPVIAHADLVVVVLDATREIEPGESALHVPRSLIVTNKCDIGTRRGGSLALCARSGTGVDDLRRAIRDRFGCAELSSLHARCWTDVQRAELNLLLDTLV